MTRSFKVWLSGFLMTALLVSLSVAWVDKPIANLIHDVLGSWQVPDAVVQSPGLSIPLAAALIFVIFGLLVIAGRKFSKLEIAILLCDISVLAADATKNQLKYVFGRTWPDSLGSADPISRAR